MNRTRPIAALALVLTLGACTPDPTVTGSPTPSTTPSPTPTPLTAAETLQEAGRLMNADPDNEPNRLAELCRLFTPDALTYDPVTAGTAVPMARWCGASAPDRLPDPGYQVKNQTPQIEEQITGPHGEPWVRVKQAGETEYQLVGALTETGDGWRITGWCSYGLSQVSRGVVHGDDPFHCLRDAQ